MSDDERRYSIGELTNKVKEYIELDEELSERRARDYVTRVLLERPGQGARTPYSDQVLYKLLFLLRLKQKAPKLELMDIGRIIRSLPDDVVERVGKGEEPLELPRLPDPDTYAEHFRRDSSMEAMELPLGVADEDTLMESVPTLEVRARGLKFGDTAIRRPPEDWTTIATARGIRLQVKADLTVAQQRQLDLIADLIKEIIDRR
jgi:hypothetical protein